MASGSRGSGSHAGAGAGVPDGLVDPQVASLPAAELVARLVGVVANRDRQSEYVQVALVLGARERRLAAVESQIRAAGEVVNGLRDEIRARERRASEVEAQIRRAAENEARLREALGSWERRVAEAEARLQADVSARDHVAGEAQAGLDAGAGDCTAGEVGDEEQDALMEGEDDDDYSDGVEYQVAITQLRAQVDKLQYRFCAFNTESDDIPSPIVSPFVDPVSPGQHHQQPLHEEPEVRIETSVDLPFTRKVVSRRKILCQVDDGEADMEAEEQAVTPTARARTARRSSLSSAITKKFQNQGHMVSLFRENIEYCLLAVCALHRQGMLTAEAIGGEGSKAQNRRLSEHEISRATKLVKFLLDGNVQGRLKKSLAELHTHDPEGVALLEEVAVQCRKQVYDIYKSKKDPYFC
ncbi:hypothetical protein ACP70R_023088 [Stipagrostis hirtigluma subsp. patula]